MCEFTNGSEVCIMACSDCNTKCKHCYISYSGNIREDILLDLCHELSHKYKIFLNGTEILLHPGFLDSIKFNKQRSLITNGLVSIFKMNLS